MATEVVMPKLGLTMERGTIGAWLKAEGEDVERGEPLLEVVTDKVTMEVEAQAAGVLRRIFVEAGEEVDVATPIGVIAALEEDITSFEPSSPAPTSPSPQGSIPQGERIAASPRVTERGDGRRPHRASPKARRIAEEHGIALEGITGSGPSGRIVSADVEARVGTQVPPTAASPVHATHGAVNQVVELTRPQQIAAERLTASSQQAPHIYLEIAVCAVKLEQLRAGYATEDRKVSYNDLILKATAMALQEHPRVNSHFVDGRVHQQQVVDIGIATDTPQGLMVPVLRDVTARDIDDIATESRRLVDRARHNRLSLDEMTGGSFTLSNLGMFGITRFTAIINPPQVAILAVGAIERTVVALGTDGMAVRPTLCLTLSADHRAIDGVMAARFLQRLKDILENPGLLG
jgi:pyruvate dehydrogenase E2 component (dihydrolipoamide acetyltransferase)